MTTWQVSETPFRHWISTDAFPLDELRAAGSSFPEPESPAWKTYTGEREFGKQECCEEILWPLHAATVLYRMRTRSWIEMLENLTGHKGLLADTWGGGMHQTARNGRLDLHADFNRHPTLAGYDRVLNLIVFLNPAWSAEYGGQLVLDDGTGEERATILPALGTTVIFETGETTFHGHPNPVVGSLVRKSLAVYYYAPAHDDEQRVGEHTTVWMEDHRAS